MSAANEVDRKAKQNQGKKGHKDLINDNSPLNFLEEGLDYALEVANDHLTSVMAVLGANSIVGNPLGKT